MLRQWLYMGIALVASILLFLQPVFNFQDDKGIIYVRSFSMDRTTVTVTQTELETGISHVKAIMPVRGFLYCQIGMLVGCILALLSYFNDEWRVWCCTLTAITAGVYYYVLIRYAIRLSDEFYATLYPNYMALLPAIVLQTMLLTRQNILRSNQEAE